ncbi:MAG: glycoside hydrolase family 95 protein [Clostridia bacterium]|nr:glycoside hydrolase family 95 protein [Clostridia bacterium]
MEKLLKYNAPATIFEEALPIGNGSLGAMIYADTELDKIPLNHDTLWSGKPEQYIVEGAKESFQRAQKLVEEGKYHDAQVELEENFTGMWLNSYLMLGELYIKYKNQGEVTSYQRTLDLENSIVTVSYLQNGIKFEREYFISYPDNCMMIKLKSSSPASYEIYGGHVGKSHTTAGDSVLYFTFESPTTIGPEYAAKQRPVTYDGESVKASAMARVIADGEVETEGDSLFIKNVTDATIYFCAETSFIDVFTLPNKPTFKPCLDRIGELAKKPYDEIKKSHIADASSLFNRVKTDFGGKPSDKTTDRRLKDGDKDLGMCELLFNFGRYLIISASRKGSRATNLQGIWNDKFYAPWSSNYTVNINLEMNYWPVLMCNLPECHEPIIDLIKSASVKGKETAEKFYGAPGFVSHHNMDLWANTTPVGNKVVGSSRYAFWNMSSGWLCRHLYEHYEYTGDKEFLNNVAYPIMKESALFYLFMLKEKDGKYIMTPSTSPENGVIIDGQKVFTLPYTTMTQSIIEDLFTNISKSAEILGIDDDFVKEVNEKKDRVGIYQIGSQGQLLEYDKEYEEEDVHHRHVSHLYALYPADIITTDKTKELAEACRQTLEIRGDESTGWSMGWKVNLWARLKDGDRAMKLVKTQLTCVAPNNEINYSEGGGTYPNMFDAHPPFQIDGNYGVCAGIAQMFLQCENNKIKILPALPREMDKGYIKGLLAKGNITVDIEWEKNKLKNLKLVTPIKQTAIINIDGKDTTIQLEAGKEYSITA